MESICICVYNGQLLCNWNFDSTGGPPGVPVGYTGTPSLSSIPVHSVQIRPLLLSGGF